MTYISSSDCSSSDFTLFFLFGIDLTADFLIVAEAFRGEDLFAFEGGKGSSISSPDDVSLVKFRSVSTYTHTNVNGRNLLNYISRIEPGFGGSSRLRSGGVAETTKRQNSWKYNERTEVKPRPILR